MQIADPQLGSADCKSAPALAMIRAYPEELGKS